MQETQQPSSVCTLFQRKQKLTTYLDISSTPIHFSLDIHLSNSYWRGRVRALRLTLSDHFTGALIQLVWLSSVTYVQVHSSIYINISWKSCTSMWMQIDSRLDFRWLSAKIRDSSWVVCHWIKVHCQICDWFLSSIKNSAIYLSD